MKIAIVTCATKNREWLYNITNPTKEKYCKEHSIDYKFDTDFYPDKEYLPGWNKILYIRKYLDQYDYVMWLDDDAGFIRFDFDMQKFIEDNFTDDKFLLICRDKHNINSGVMIFKSCKESKAVLEYIWKYRSLFKTDHHGYTGVMEQPAIIDFCLKCPNKVIIGDGHILNAYDEVYYDSPINARTTDSVILHIAGGSDFKNKRRDLIRDLFSLNNV